MISFHKELNVKNNIVEVLLNDILGIFWVFDDLRCGFQGTLAKVNFLGAIITLIFLDRSSQKESIV